MQRITTVSAVFIAFITSVPLVTSALAAKPDQPGSARANPPAAQHSNRYSQTSILVRYKSGTRANDKAAARSQSKGSLMRASKVVPGLEQLSVESGRSVAETCAMLEKLPFVEYAHPDYILHVDQVPPDDEYFTEQWALNNTGQDSFIGAFLGGTPDADIDWLEARALATGSGVVIAVLDTGVDYRHTDIASNVWLNTAEVNGTPGVDDDGNGYIDDERGWDFVNNDPYPLDGHGHGTIVSGIIAAVTHNTKGIAGIMPDGQVMALKVISDGGIGLLSHAIEGLEYAIDKGVRISNNSWGYSEILPEELADHNALFDTIQAARADDHLFIAAAGNEGVDTDVTAHYPSSFELDNIIAVGATTNTDDLAWFSSYGVASVDIAAPGDVVISVTKLFAGAIEDYAWESGTSLAAPHVSGVAGLIMELQPGLDYKQIRTRLLSTGRVVPALAGTSATGAVVNAFDAVNGLPLQVVAIDVLPGEAPNVVYPNQIGELPVAVLGSASFDATQVDPASLKFGVGGAVTTKAPVIADVDGLHGPDSTAVFPVSDSGILCDDIEVSLTGATYGGDQFMGADSIDASQCVAGGCHAY